MPSSSSLILLLTALSYGQMTSASCNSGAKSDNCANNPNPKYRDSDLQYQEDTCNLKWDKCNNDGQQKPPAYFLCNKLKEPAGHVRTDFYTLSMQNNFDTSSPYKYTLHGVWPGSQFGRGDSNQPNGCENGESFDEQYLTSFNDLFNTFWPSDPKYGNTQECFILSEWMKHGTCAVIAGKDGTAFRINQEDYYRTAIVIANEYNVNPSFQATMGPPKNTFMPTECVQCAYYAASTWRDYTVDSVPRMPSYCIDQCVPCSGSDCHISNLDSTVEEDYSNAPVPPQSLVQGGATVTATVSASGAAHVMLATAPAAALAASATPTLVVPSSVSSAATANAIAESSSHTDFADLGLEGGVWRSWGAEQIGSGKFEFTQTFSKGKFQSTTDSPYPNECNYRTYLAPTSSEPEHVLLFNCGANKHTEDCLVKRLPDIGGLDVAFFACNHSGIPAPLNFHEAMDTKNLGNFLMFRCKQSSESHQCQFNTIAAPLTPATAASASAASTAKPSIHAYQPGVGGAPKDLLGSWRTLEVQHNYEVGLVRWNFTSDGQATAEFPNYPARGVQRYAVTHSVCGSKVYLSGASGIKSCLFDFQYNSVYSYALLACGADNQPAPANFLEGFEAPNTQWAMGRCIGCSGDCFYSCGPQNDNCGRGSCEPPAAKVKTAAAAKSAQAQWTPPNWCGIGEKGCWPTMADILALEQELGPNDPRTGLHWTAQPQPQTAPVPPASTGDLPLYGLGQTNLKALYHYDNLDDIHKPCFPAGNTGSYQNASDICKASVRGNEYRNWNPFLVVFPLNERQVRAALKFAVKHRLCIATSGTGHEYNGRQVCPAGGILIRTILLKDKAFLPTWEEDPTVSPHGAFRFGSGIIFTELHAYSAGFNRLVSSGWCSTVGIPGWHLGGGHGPFAPSLGLGVDNALEYEILQIGYDENGQSVIHKVYASRRKNPQLFWAMRGGGGGVWGVILSITTRAHLLPAGGLTNVQFTVNGDFAQNSDKYSYEWLRGFWQRYANWNLLLNQKVSTQPGFFPNTDKYATTHNLKDVTWSFTMEYFYAGGKNESEYKLFRDKLIYDVFEVTQITPALQLKEITYPNAYAYVLSMPPNKFLLNVNNPLPPPHVPSLQATGSQNSVFVSREAMLTGFARTMMSVLDICVSTLQKPDPTSPAANGYRCGFHYLYTSITGNLGSSQPHDTAIAPGFRSGLMLWNARTLTVAQADETLYTLGPNSYFSESSYVLPDWVHHYWGESRYQQLLAVKRAHDPGNHFWCHHCVGDNPEDADGAVYDLPKGNLLGH